jgi:hypothetical protein
VFDDELPLCLLIVQVRLAAVAAVVSLSSQDHLFADAAGLLLADLVGDQLPSVRLSALKALLDQATAFHLHKQALQQAQTSQPQQQHLQQQHLQQQQKQQQQQPGIADQPRQQQQQQGAEQPTDADDVDMEGAEGPTQQQGSQEGDTSSQAQEAASESDAEQQQSQEAATAPGLQQQQQQQPQQQRRSKVRKSDLPPWGKDALLAASNALSDAEPAVRQLALQLLQHLPPGNAPDLVIVIRALAACCQRYPDQHAEQAWGLVNSLSSMRAEMITLVPGKLVPLLGSLLQPSPAAGATGDGLCKPEAVQGDTSPGGQPGSAHAAAAAAAAASVLGSAAAADIARLPQGAQVLAALLLLGVQSRKQGLPTSLKELEKAGLLELPALQLWQARLCAVQGP